MKKITAKVLKDKSSLRNTDLLKFGYQSLEQIEASLQYEIHITEDEGEECFYRYFNSARLQSKEYIKEFFSTLYEGEEINVEAEIDPSKEFITYYVYLKNNGETDEIVILVGTEIEKGV